MPDLGPAGWLVPFWPQYLRGYPAFSLLTLVPFPALVHRGAGRLLRARDPDGFAPFLEDTAPLRVEDAVPFLFVPGNHDLYRRRDRRELARHFGAPAGALGREHPDALWFAFDAAGFRFVVLDTGSDVFLGRNRFPSGGRQLRWLDATLADAAARGLPAIVALHLPPFSSAREDRPAPGVAARIVRGVLDRHRVALVLSGHAHAYERIERPGHGDRPVTYVVSGGGGAPFHRLAPPARRDPGSRAFVERTLHFVLLELDGERIRGRAVPVPPATELDRFEVPLR
jgi:3',5'-cyclic AMP phosphodiesterase CpdA